MFDFESNVKKLAELRKKGEGFKNILVEAEEAYNAKLQKFNESSNEYAKMEDVNCDLSEIKASIYNVEKAIKDAMKVTYNESGEKKPYPGLSIAVSQKLKVVDDSAMLSWCKSNMPVFLSEVVDTKALEKVCKDSGMRVEGAELVDNIIPKISTKL